MRSFSHLNTAAEIIRQYDGSLPLAAWLKQYFREHKKFGSSDRRSIAHLCFSWFRLGGAFPAESIEERLLRALFLCSDTPQPILRELRPEWDEAVSIPLDNKLQKLGAEEEVLRIFPFSSLLSPAVDRKAFSRSLLVQPDLFLRLRPGMREKVEQKLRIAGIPIQTEAGAALRLPNQSKLEEVLEPDREAVIQDLSSQQVLAPLENRLPDAFAGPVWDCCAASGGKSLLLHDTYPHARLIATDVRESILVNLRKRFERAGIRSYQSFVADVGREGFQMKQRFPLILCDAPCSGSGTWGRTPEALSFFTREKAESYAALQKSIAVGAGRALKPGGLFLYITCSVFSCENEDVVSFLQEREGWTLLDQRYFLGYEKKADTLFAALLTRS